MTDKQKILLADEMLTLTQQARTLEYVQGYVRGFKKACEHSNSQCTGDIPTITAEQFLHSGFPTKFNKGDKCRITGDVRHEDAFNEGLDIGDVVTICKVYREQSECVSKTGVRWFIRDKKLEKQYTDEEIIQKLNDAEPLTDNQLNSMAMPTPKKIDSEFQVGDEVVTTIETRFVGKDSCGEVVNAHTNKCLVRVGEETYLLHNSDLKKV